MLYYIERTKIARDESYVTISIGDDGSHDRRFMFDESSEFSDAEKDKLNAVVPIDGFVASTLDYKVCNFTYDPIAIRVCNSIYDPIAIRVLVRRNEK